MTLGRIGGRGPRARYGAERWLPLRLPRRRRGCSGGCSRCLPPQPARGLDKAVVRSLGTGQWVRAKQNVIVIGMTATLFVPQLVGKTGWALPDDLWGTLVAAQRLVHLDLSGLYKQPTGLVTFPGAAVILAPEVAVSDAAGLSLSHPGPHNAQPLVWLLAGPYMIALSALALFAADALAEDATQHGEADKRFTMLN